MTNLTAVAWLGVTDRMVREAREEKIAGLAGHSL
jgi:hypothetical protein